MRLKLVRRSGKKGLPGVPIILNFNVLNESKKNSSQKIGRGKNRVEAVGVFI